MVRVVHISDTRGAHKAFAEHIPRGHILIHSGDFAPQPPSFSSHLSNWCRKLSGHLPLFKKNRRTIVPPNDWRRQVKELDSFFAEQPHSFKIFVPGCWEKWYSYDKGDVPTPEKIQALLKSAIYLEDSWCRLYGLIIYGIPWTAADDLRSEDGSFIERHFSKYSQLRFGASQLGFNNLHEVIDPPTSSDQPTFDVCNPTPRSNGFVLPTIETVAKQWEKIPDNTHIVVTHMPAWRPELYSHITERVRPILHLCGHDFVGYGVMWKHGTLFSNAALQLTSSFPVTGLTQDYLTKARKGAKNHADNESNGRRSHKDIKFNTAVKTFDRECDTVKCMDYLNDFHEPQLFPIESNGQQRPRRWKRRLPKSLSRFFSLNARPTGCFIFPRLRRTKTSVVVVSATQSSKAAVTQAGSDPGFIYDPDMRAGVGAMSINDPTCSSTTNLGYAGGNTGLSGSSICSASCRRSPIVIDVYVVNDDLDVILPSYTPTSNI